MSRIHSAEVPQGVLAAIGGTPLVRLTRLLPDLPFEIFAKLEHLNPGGSLKDRVAVEIIRGALDAGEIHTGSVIVESSSGNMGIALAQVCAYFGLRLVCVVDPKATAQNLAILEAFGAEVDLVREPDPQTGEFLPARKKRVQDLLKTIPHSFWPNQYANRANPTAHCRGTMREIVDALDGHLDLMFCATSTCGTIAGCRLYIQEQRLTTRLVAVDASGSALFHRRRGDRRRLPGLGSTEPSLFFDPNWADAVIHVTDADCVAGCRKLLRREAICSGGSSGGVVSALEKVSSTIPSGARCAIIVADRGERYLDTIYSDEWVRSQFGDAFDA